MDFDKFLNRFIDIGLAVMMGCIIPLVIALLIKALFFCHA